MEKLKSYLKLVLDFGKLLFLLSVLTLIGFVIFFGVYGGGKVLIDHNQTIDGICSQYDFLTTLALRGDSYGHVNAKFSFLSILLVIVTLVFQGYILYLQQRNSNKTIKESKTHTKMMKAANQLEWTRLYDEANRGLFSTAQQIEMDKTLSPLLEHYQRLLVNLEAQGKRLGFWQSD